MKDRQRDGWPNSPPTVSCYWSVHSVIVFRFRLDRAIFWTYT